MNIAFYIKLYLLTVPIFFAVDIIWLGYLARNFYRDNLDFVLAPSVNWTAAIVFYLIYIVGIIIFAVQPGLEKASLNKALMLGALFGFFTYATYDLTNMATIKDWPLKVVLVDIIWGTVLCTIVAGGSFMIGQWLQRGA